MEKLKLTLIPMFIGIVLLFLSWYISYPVSIDSPYDFVYNHISPLYWASLTILFASFFIIGINTKNNILRWIIAVSTVSLIYSSSYFYYMIPGSDSLFFRGLTEYFISTGDLNPTRVGTYHGYYQWPSFFMLNKVATSIAGLDLRFFEFMLFGIIGFLLATSLYLYASKARANGYVAVVALFIIIRYFFNYQWAPFSVATCLLLLLFVLDKYAFRKREATLAILVIFFSMTLTHAFVPVFFIIYSIMMYIVNKNRKYLKLFLLTLIIYLTVSIYYTVTFFTDLVQQLTSVYTLEYYGQVEAVLATSMTPRPYIDMIAQIFSRTAVITTTIITGLAFIILLIKRKLRKKDHAILLTGVSYLAIGFLFPILGTRAIFLAAIPVSLGASYLAESRFKRYFRPLFLVLLLLFTFGLIHGTFYDRYIQFQTKEAYTTANFMIERYNWTHTSTILSHIAVRSYILAKVAKNAILETDVSPRFLEMNVETYDCIVHSVGLEKSLLGHNFSTQEISHQIENRFNVIYSSGLSYIASRANATN